MNAGKTSKRSAPDAAARSAIYRTLAQGFTYGAGDGPYAMPGYDFNAAFDPSIGEEACTLREGLYTEEDQSSVFEELMRFYAFFGLARAEDAEMPDHLSVELEFMHYLTHLEAVTEGTPEELQSLRLAQRDFVQRHLRRVTGGVRAGLKSSHPACVRLVNACADFIESELALLERPAAT